jgi:uncharacterized protein YkvS
MKSRSLFIYLTTGIVILLLITVGSFYWIYQPLSLTKGGVKTNPQATMFVSKQAPVMVSLLVNPERLTAFSQWQREIEQIRDNLLAKTKLDYKGDLQNWLGDEVTLAVTSLDFDRNPANGVQPGYLLALKTKDSQLAKEFLQIYYSKQAISDTAELIFEQYKGVNLIFQNSLIPTGEVSRVASAVVGDFVLFANNLKVLKEAINNAQVVNLNLTHYQPYQDALKTMAEPKISLAYLNLPATSAWIANYPLPENPVIQQTLTLSLALKRQGLVTHTALFGVTGEENQPPSLSSPPETLNYIPRESILVAAGQNLNQLWQQIATGLPQNSPLQQVINQAIAQIETPLGINLAEDIFSWVGGEYAISLLPDETTNELNWMFVTKNPDITPLETLDNLAKTKGLSVGDLPLLDTTITAWTKLTTTSQNDFASLEAKVKGVHTAIPPYQLLANSVDLLSDTISRPNNSLLNSEKFQLAIEALPPENDGYLYIDWPKFEPIIARKFPIIRVAELAIKPLFDNLRSLTITSEGAENGVRRATVFLRF